ncbi:MAG: NADH-quinone oxidoreductase subunit NuoN [Steroidobacteraceae bacterium]
MPAPISWSSVAPAVAEMYLAFAACVILLVEVFAGERRRGLTPTLTLLALVVGAALLVLFGQVHGTVKLFNGMYIEDELGFVLKLAGFLFLAFTILYSRAYLGARGIERGEYYVLLLTALLGVFVLVSANDMITVYLGVELLALSVYAIIAFDRDNPVAAEAAMKYFVLSCIASGVLLYGMSLVYGLTGTLRLDELVARLAGGPLRPGVVLGLAFIVVAVCFKFGAVPFHMWLPDVYQGAPTSMTLFLSSVPQIAYFSLALRLLTYGLHDAGHAWTVMLMPITVLTLVIGNVVAIVQTNLKRMLAYSAIGNVGFILLGFVAGTPDGYSAALYYTLVYIIMVLGSFGVILLASRKGFEAEELEDYKGLYARDPLLALAMLALMFSTAGIPPFVGFWAKLRIIQALWTTSHPALVIIAAAMSVVGCFYYLRVVKLMYFDAPTGELPDTRRGSPVRAVLAVNALAVLVLGVLPGPLLDLCAYVLR